MFYFFLNRSAQMNVGWWRSVEQGAGDLGGVTGAEKKYFKFNFIFNFSKYLYSAHQRHNFSFHFGWIENRKTKNILSISFYACHADPMTERPVPSSDPNAVVYISLNLSLTISFHCHWLCYAFGCCNHRCWRCMPFCCIEQIIDVCVCTFQIERHRRKQERHNKIPFIVLINEIWDYSSW